MVNNAFITFLRNRTSLLLVFAGVLVFETYNLTTPAYWGDEAATITASTRPLHSFFVLIKKVDAVHAVYYFGMHFWIKLFGASELSVRLPEAVAVTAAGAILFAVLKKRTDLLSALVATVCFAMMPRVMWAAGIGRSYAFTILFGVILTWLFLRIIEAERPHRGWFIAYFATAAIACNVFIYVIFMVVTQVATLIILRVNRHKLWRFAVAALGAVALATPVAILAKDQSAQLGWIRNLSTNYFEIIFGSVLFYGDPVASTTVWVIVAVGLALLVSKKTRNGKTDARLTRQALIASSLVAFVPSSAVYLYSLVNHPIFNGRYFSFAAGAVAVMLALAVYQLRFTWIKLLALVLIAASSFAPATFWRAEYRFGNDNDQVASFIHNNAHRGDAVLFAPISKHCTGVCTAAVGYADQFNKVSIIGMKNEALKLGYLHDRYRSADLTMLEAKSFRRIWVLQGIPGAPKFDTPYYAGLAKLGFKPTTSKSLKFETITLYQR